MANPKKKKYYPWEFWATPKFIQIDPKLTLADKAILSVMITRMNGDNELKMKQEIIAEEIGVSLISVKRAIKKLEKLGLMTVERFGSNICNRYKISI